jgi:Family of unknown function (DUF6209)
MKPIYILFLLYLFTVISCSENGSENENIIVAPVIGNYDGNDLSDHNCSVVLLQVSRQSNGTGGYIDDGSSWIWFGQIDVSTDIIENGNIPKVAFHSGSLNDWHESDCHKIPGASNGFQRFEFELDSYLPGPGMGGTAITQSVIELIPFISMSNGDRLFDHNRNNGEFDNYLLSVDNNWSLANSGDLCSKTIIEQPFKYEDTLLTGSLSFGDDMSKQITGKLIEGNRIEINYALERLPNCRGTHNGYPAWDTRVFVKFLPGQEMTEGSVRDFVNNMGLPTNESFSIPVSFDIPLGTESVEIWFSNTSLGGYSCQEWDSNLGENYKFDVMRAPGWIGDHFLNISRESSIPCSQGVSLVDSFTYGTWDRERSLVGNVCFEVWQEGVTDQANQEIWKELDTRVWYRFGESEFHFEYVDFIDYTGNNARYAFNIEEIDPFRPYLCPEVNVSQVTDPDGDSFDVAEMEFFFTVNGIRSTPETENYFAGAYIDYANNPYREENCN